MLYFKFRRRQRQEGGAVFLLAVLAFLVWTGLLLWSRGPLLGRNSGEETEERGLLAQSRRLAEETAESLRDTFQKTMLAMTLPGAGITGEGLETAGALPAVSGQGGESDERAASSQAALAASGRTKEFYGDLEEDYTLWEDPYEARWPEFARDDVVLIPEGEPKILIYHTHASEEYTGDEGGKGGVLSAGRMLTQVLEGSYGIKTAHSEAINDQPDFTRAYINSQNLLEQYVEKYPTLVTTIDLHRDAGMKSRQDTLVTINGKECAKLLLVMGDAYEGYQKNWDFADRLYAKCQELYPGLMKPVRPAEDRRYNQHLHPRAILLEVGSNLNTAEDARNSVTLCAEVLYQVLKEEGLLE